MTFHRPPPGGSPSWDAKPLALSFPLLGGRTGFPPRAAALLASLVLESA